MNNNTNRPTTGFKEVAKKTWKWLTVAKPGGIRDCLFNPERYGLRDKESGKRPK